MELNRYYLLDYPDPTEKSPYISLVDKTMWDHFLPLSGMIDQSLKLVFDGDLVGLADCPFTVPDCRLYSSRVRRIIDKHLAEDDVVQWIPTIIKDQHGRQTDDYWVLHLPDPIDAIWTPWWKPRRRDQFLPPFILDHRKIGRHKVFVWRPGSQTFIVVSEDIKNDIEKHKITNIECREVRQK